jgi:hypothetical protein
MIFCETYKTYKGIKLFIKLTLYVLYDLYGKIKTVVIDN